MTSQTSSTEGPWLKLLRHCRLGHFTACRLGFFSLLTDLQSSEKELVCLEIPEDFSFCFSCFDGNTIQGNIELPRFVRGSWMRVEPKVVLLTVVPQAPNEVKESQNLPLCGLSREWGLPSNPTCIWRWKPEAKQRRGAGWALRASSACDCPAGILLEFPLPRLFCVIMWGNTNRHNRHPGWPDKTEQMSKHHHSKRYTKMPEFVFFFIPLPWFWVGNVKQKASDISRYFYFKPFHYTS